jgi:hypothetical protein
MSSDPQPPEPCDAEPPVAQVKAKKPMTAVQAENLAKARAKSLENRKAAALLREKEEQLKKTDMELRWQRVKDAEARLEKEKAVQKKKPKKSVILHVSPPLSPRKAEEEEEETDESGEEEAYDPSTSRRAYRARASQARSPTPPRRQQQQDPPPPPVQRGPTQEEQLRMAYRMLGLR